MVLTAAQLAKIATFYAEAAQKVCESPNQTDDFAWKANWFHSLSRIAATSGAPMFVRRDIQR